jgi:dTDP-glucose 4,6-dehydratase
MTYLITGGAGFIGGNFVHYMLTNYPDDKVIVVDKLTYAGNMETLSSKLAAEYLVGEANNTNNHLFIEVTPPLENPNLTFIKADICDREAIREIFIDYKPDIVINFAAETHVDRSIDTPDLFLQTNVLGTQVLMDICRTHTPAMRFDKSYNDCSGVYFHQVSTDEVYGDLPLDRPELLFTESTPLHTSSPYSASKAAADLLVLAYHRTYGLPVTISRCSNNYGPYHFPEKLIPLMIANALMGKDLPVYDKGLNVRDWLYCADHCRGIDVILKKGVIGEVYNIGGHNERTNIDVVRFVQKTIANLDHEYLRERGFDVPENLGGTIKHVNNRAGHDLRYAIDPTKIEALGWKSTVKFEDGLKLTIKWYLENREWWTRIINGEYKTYYTAHYES